MTYDGTTLSSTSTPVLTGIAKNRYHNGGRIRFGPDGKLYATVGDAKNSDNAQNKSSLNGKILRLNPDGSAPSDNPFYATGGNARYVWSYGHRNPQGLAWDSHGQLWAAEFGESSLDELNLIQKGGNFGWPSCEGTQRQLQRLHRPEADLADVAGRAERPGDRQRLDLHRRRHR